jgi:predicted Zn-ribbon and HTH transcriptional regulator
MKVHIVEYTCEHCGFTHTHEAGVDCDGMCPVCKSPMRIEDLFGDRRFATLPVDEERRHHAA